MHILLTNDDGIRAPGLLALRRELLSLGEVTVVAPEEECSGIGHAITIGSPITLRKVWEEEGDLGYAVEGTPADCVKIGLAGNLQGSFDIVVSGVNWGANAGMNLLYSGTVAAALEAAYSGCLGVAASLERGPAADFTVAAKITRFILEILLERKLPGRGAFSINIPARGLGDIKGIRIAPQDAKFYEETFKHSSFPDGRQAFSLIESGSVATVARGDHSASARRRRVATNYRRDRNHDATEWVLLSQGYVTITPLTINLTERSLLKRLKKWSWARKFQNFQRSNH